MCASLSVFTQKLCHIESLAGGTPHSILLGKTCNVKDFEFSTRHSTLGGCILQDLQSREVYGYPASCGIIIMVGLVGILHRARPPFPEGLWGACKVRDHKSRAGVREPAGSALTPAGKQGAASQANIRNGLEPCVAMPAWRGAVPA
jgi:hypothetical protein